MVLLKTENTYKIYTDASFDTKTKIGTYAVIIKQNNKVIKAFGRRCRTKLENSTECEVFAIFQAINIIDIGLLKKDKKQNFLIHTDCESAKDFFKANKKVNIFKKDVVLFNKIKQSSKSIKEKLSKNHGNLTINCIPRSKNTIAHNYSYKEFKSFRQLPDKSIYIDKTFFLRIIKESASKTCKVIMILSQISDKDDLIFKTQNEIADLLDISVSTINKIFKDLIQLNVLSKIKNGIYSLNLY